MIGNNHALWLGGDKHSGYWYCIFNRYFGWAMDNSLCFMASINETNRDAK